MSIHAGLKPSKFTSALAAVVGGGITIGGIVLVVQTGHPVPIVGTVLAVVMTGYHVVNLLSDRAPLMEEIHVSDDRVPRPNASTADRLCELKQLKAAGLVNDDEFSRKRAEILREL